MNHPQPRILGRYALYDAIASGGMASIYLGKLLGPVGFSRTVAIKRLHEQFARDPEFVAMFLDEARIAARIQHPNVVSTLDVVAVEGEIFLVMEYIQGESLSFLLKQSRNRDQLAPLPIVGRVIGEVLLGLHAAHEAKNERGEPLNIVHRDISPQNVLIDLDGVARVLDFGIAKAVGRMVQTREGQIKGKLSYMAPEQVNGREVSRATDIYAIAIVLWEALTGQRLIRSDSDVEAMYRILEDTPPAPSTIVPGIPPALDALVLRGLQKNPADRFATAREMALALDTVIPSVSSAVVSDWVQRLAGERIAERSRTISRIESESSQPSLDLTALVAEASSPGLSAEPSTNPAATSPTIASAAPAPRHPALLWGLVALGALGAVGVGVAVRRSSEPASDAPVAASPSSSAQGQPGASAEPSKPASSTPSSPGTAVVSPPPDASASAAASTASTPGSAPVKGGARGARPPEKGKGPAAKGDIYQRD